MAEKWVHERLEQYKLDFEAGDAVAIHTAVLFAAWNKIPTPEWAIPWLKDVLEMHVNGYFKRRQGLASDAVVSRRLRNDAGIHGMAKWLLALNPSDWRLWAGNIAQTQANAFDVIARDHTRLNKGKPRGKIVTPAMVKAIYYRVEKRGSKNSDSLGSDTPPNV